MPPFGDEASLDDDEFVVPEVLGNIVISKKNPTYTQDHGDGIATRGESVVHVPS